MATERVGVRMPVGLLERIRLEAEADDRTLSYVIVKAMEKLFPEKKPSRKKK